MDTIDVQNKSFVVRWQKVSQGDIVSFRLKPLKKSIGFGIYRRFGGSSTTDLSETNHGSVKASSNSNTNPLIRISTDAKPNVALADHEKDKNVPLQTRLAQSGLEKVTWYGTISNNDTVAESFESTCESCYYAFILDNTTSKQTKKKCLFSVSINPSASAMEGLDDDQESVISNQEESFGANGTNGKRPLNYSQTSFKDPSLSSLAKSNSNPFAPSPGQTTPSTISNVGTSNGPNTNSPVPIKPLSPSSTSATDHDLKNSKGFQGYLLKKKRKKLQGFTKRFFKLDIKFGILSYYLNSKSPVCRGEIVVPLSSISANKQTKLIIIDSGMEIWVMKARDEKDWELWISMIESCFKQDAPTTSQDHESHNVVIPPDNDTTAFFRNLTSLRKRIEECKYQSLSYSNYTPNAIVSPIQGPPTSSKQQRNVSRSSSVSSFMNSFSRQRNGSFVEQATSGHDTSILSNNPNEPQHHDLYRKLADLEKIAKQLDIDGKMLATKWVPRSPTASIFSDDEYFDANEEPIITMLNDDVAFETDIRPIYSSYNDEDEEEEGEGEEEEEAEEEEEEEEDEMTTTTTTTPTSNELMTSTDRKTIETATSRSQDLSPLPINKTIKRRNDIAIPVSTPPSLLGFLRKNVGKDLSSISMPISLNEPVSILQVLSEAFEYSWLLSKAATMEDDEVQRLKYISAFALSYMSIHRQKTRSLRKPFTPLLGETYEIVREDMGIRLVSEKVCHKPPIFAFYTEHRDWKCSYTVTPVQKFWGKSIEFTNEGVFELTFNNIDAKYRWSQPTIVLKNIIAGERYMEPSNQFSISTSTNLKSIIAFKAGGMFSGRSEDVDVSLVNEKGQKLGSLKGQWTKEVRDLDNGQQIWKCGPLVENSEKKYGFTVFTSNLNEITETEKDHLPPTDSRLRPDIRLYENGIITEAEQMKLSLEQKQRERRDKGEDAQPQYFKQIKPMKWLPVTGENNYWERRKRHDWSNTKSLW